MSNIRFKPGDKVTAYWQGYFEVITVQRRFRDPDNTMRFGFIQEAGYIEMSPLATVVQIYRANGTPIKSKRRRTCDESFLVPAEDHRRNRIKALEDEIKALKSIKF